MQKCRQMTLCYDVIIVDIYQKRSTSLGLRYNCNIDLERGCFFSIFHFSIYLFFQLQECVFKSCHLTAHIDDLSENTLFLNFLKICISSAYC